ncbi:MAG TPA: hypothetical protein VL418_03895 [Devosiaceae bacterium]|nr:hypothetical protein [Devosiaceae bacterium]
MKLALAGALVLALLLVGPALAADPNAVVVPWGDWLVALINFVLPVVGIILTAALTWLARYLPAALKAYVTTQNIDAAEQLLERGVDFGLNRVEGAAVGKTLDVAVGSRVLATSAQYVIDHGPAKLIAWLGGEDAIRQKILARLSLEPGADGGQVLSPEPGASPMPLKP